MEFILLDPVIHLDSSSVVWPVVDSEADNQLSDVRDVCSIFVRRS